MPLVVVEVEDEEVEFKAAVIHAGQADPVAFRVIWLLRSMSASELTDMPLRARFAALPLAAGGGGGGGEDMELVSAEAVSESWFNTALDRLPFKIGVEGGSLVPGSDDVLSDCPRAPWPPRMDS